MIRVQSHDNVPKTAQMTAEFEQRERTRSAGRKLVSMMLLFASFTLLAQEPVGEVSSGEILIEKNKKITLPRADKLFLPIGVQGLIKDSIHLTFNLHSPQFSISPFEPILNPYDYAVASDKLPYQNFVKVGFGSYGSPLLSSYVEQGRKGMSWGAFLYHESFGSGSVRGKESASGTNYVDVFATFQNARWVFTPTFGWQSDGFRFYGYGNGDTRISTDRSAINRLTFSGILEKISVNDWTLSVKPTFRSTTQNTVNNALKNSEKYLSLLTEVSYTFDSALSAGVDLQMGAITFGSQATHKRNLAKVNPWVGLKQASLFIQAGVELATTNDTMVSGTKSFFYPDISVEWSGLPKWTVYGGLSGELKPVTFSSISQKNMFMDDSLVMAHENVKSKINGGIRGAVTSTLFLNAGITLSSVENMSFFMPSPNDSARFILAIDPESVTIFSWFGNVNFQPKEGTYLNLEAKVYNYGALEVFAEAWYKPGYEFSVDWFQRYSDKISSQVRLLSLGGIKAPNPITLTAKTLDPIVDLSLEGSYKIHDQAEVFLQVQNLFGKEYERFLNYPNRGVSFKIGGLYKF